jgi:hypothetical protein
MQFFLYKSVSSDSRTLEIYHDSVFQKCVRENKNPLPMPSLQPNYAVTEVTVGHFVV